MSSRRRRHATNSYTSASDLEFAGCAILAIFCFAKCIFDMLREDREDPIQPNTRGVSTPEINRGYQHWPGTESNFSAIEMPDRARLARDPTTFRSAAAPRPSASQLIPSNSTSSTEKPATNLSKSWECQICFEEKGREDFPLRHITESCNHEQTDCCNTCLSKAIITAFLANLWDDIRCPVCNLQLQYQDMVDFAPRNIFKRYDNLHLRRTLERELPNFRWCIGGSCTYGEEHPDASSPIIACSACGILACSHHNVLWHHGETCSEYDRRVAAGHARAESKSQRAIKSMAKRCPGCRRFINKNGGCNHMTCLCGKQFCWNCLHDFPGHNRPCTRDFN